MSSAAHTDLLSEVFTTTAGVLRTITDQDLANPTPCRGYTVGRLQDHLIGWTVAFADYLTNQEPVPSSPTYRASRQPVRDYHQATTAVLHGLRARGDRLVVKNGTQLPTAVLRVELLAEHLIHCWDLATATGREVQFTPDQILAADTGLTSMLTQPYAVEGFQPVMHDQPDGDPLSRLLARSGRRAAS